MFFRTSLFWLISIFSVSIFAANKNLSSQLQPLLGEYTLKTEDNSTCRFLDSLGKEKKVRLVLKTTKTDFTNPNHVNIDFEAFYPDWSSENGQKGEWYRAFDLAGFYSINKFQFGSPTVFGWIRHKVSFDNQSKTLKHRVTITKPTVGSGGGVQTIQWLSLNEFKYNYELIKGNGFGKTIDRELVQSCTFIRN